jgi:hypothetical protein
MSGQRFEKSQGSTRQVGLTTKKRATPVAKQAQARQRSQLAEMMPWQVHRGDEKLTDSEFLTNDIADLRDELLDEDSDLDTELDDLDEITTVESKKIEEQPDADLEGYISKPIHDPELRLETLYWFDIYERDKRFFCTFREPLLTLTSKDEIEQLSILLNSLRILAKWLSTNAQEFLREPSPQRWARVQGANYKEYSEYSLVTQKGLLHALQKWHERPVALNESNLSRLLKEDKIWLAWRAGPVIPLSILFSQQFRLEWAAYALHAWQGNLSCNWNSAEFDKKGVSGRSAENDSIHDAFTRIASLVRIDHEKLRLRMSI